MPLIEHRRYDPHHNVFRALADDATLWRYMDLTKLLAILEDRALHFARSDLLGDPFEGSLTASMIEAPTHTTDESGTLTELSPEARDVIQVSFDNLRQFRRAMRRWVWISCWNHSDIESDALWGRYVRAEHGIAIRTTFGRLVRSFGEPLPPVEARTDYEKTLDAGVFIGRVSYVDYEREAWPSDNLFWPFVHKRLSFAHESEVRALINYIPLGADGDTDYSAVMPEGHVVAVDLDRLIEEIYVSPVAPQWLFDLVRRICFRYGVKAEVRQSVLSATPVF